ncbi:redoxin domain-containing protein [Ornithinimicrobium sediminis]|uniref:redoxin domain-containing protein n=1 Tax=Ornithinimicrobium sediminis TaxID=2904603 RepID=UPI001E63A72B|nr:redoxin domain-containing protein [Ornithinimicrobium sediminis]
MALWGGALVLAACSGVETPAPGAGSPTGSEPPAGEQATDVSAAAVDPGPAVPALEGQTLDGTDLDPASVTGRSVLLWFWAPWCVVCRAEAPTVLEMAEELEDEVTVVGVAGRGTVEEMQAFVDDTGTAGLTHVADVDGATWRDFGVVAQPAFAFVTPEGGREVFVGALDEDDLRAFVQGATGEDGG